MAVMLANLRLVQRFAILVPNDLNHTNIINNNNNSNNNIISNRTNSSSNSLVKVDAQALIRTWVDLWAAMDRFRTLDLPV